MDNMSRKGNNSNPRREEIVRSDNDVDNTNKIFDRNTNNATASVRNSGNSTVDVNINVNEEDEAGVAGVAGVADVAGASGRRRSRKTRSRSRRD